MLFSAATRVSFVLCALALSLLPSASPSLSLSLSVSLSLCAFGPVFADTLSVLFGYFRAALAQVIVSCRYISFLSLFQLSRIAFKELPQFNIAFKARKCSLAHTGTHTDTYVLCEFAFALACSGNTHMAHPGHKGY